MQPPPSLVAVYHAVGTAEATGYRDALGYDALARQLDWIERRYRVRPLADLIQRRRRKEPIDGLAAITFDDNHPSVLHDALPLVAARGLPATWCLIGSVLQGQPYWRAQVHQLIREGRVEAFLDFVRQTAPQAVSGLRTDRFYKDSKDPARCRISELQGLLRRFPAGAPTAALVRWHDLADQAPPPGIALANHSFSHPPFAALSQEQQAAEIAAGAEALAGCGWPTLPVLALPFGDPGSYSPDTPKAIEAAGCEAVLLTAAWPAAADDLRSHPLMAATPALVRVVLGAANP